jgi:hypothetical protein
MPLGEALTVPRGGRCIHRTIRSKTRVKSPTGDSPPGGVAALAALASRWSVE